MSSKSKELVGIVVSGGEFYLGIGILVVRCGNIDSCHRGIAHAKRADLVFSIKIALHGVHKAGQCRRIR